MLRCSMMWSSGKRGALVAQLPDIAIVKQE